MAAYTGPMKVQARTSPEGEGKQAWSVTHWSLSAIGGCWERESWFSSRATLLPAGKSHSSRRSRNREQMLIMDLMNERRAERWRPREGDRPGRSLGGGEYGTNSQKINLKQKPSYGEAMAPCLGALTALAEVLGSHSPTWWLATVQEFWCPLLASVGALQHYLYMIYTHTCRWTVIHIKYFDKLLIISLEEVLKERQS